MIYHETEKNLALASRSERRRNDGFSTEISGQADRCVVKGFGFALMHEDMRSISAFVTRSIYGVSFLSFPRDFSSEKVVYGNYFFF
jgi:hypothetical protein